MHSLRFTALALLVSCASQPTPKEPKKPSQEKRDQLATPPADAKKWVIVSAGGTHGTEHAWTDAEGLRWGRVSILLRGLVAELEYKTRINNASIPTEIEVRGVTPSGPANESFTVENGIAKWKSPSDAGETPWNDGLIYAPSLVPFTGNFLVIEALLKDADQTLKALPGGEIRLETLTTAEVVKGNQKKTLKAVVLKGLDIKPHVFWLDSDDSYFGQMGWLSWLPEGWESVRKQLIETQEDALNARAPELRAKLLIDPKKPVLFKDVSIYNTETNAFDPGMSVLVEGNKIRKVGKKVHASRAMVVNGAEKTLIPGLWDMHNHFGGDAESLLMLSQGITSVRDIGNERARILKRKRRVDQGELLGPTIYPILGMDGDGPLAAQGFVRIKSAKEGIETLAKAKEEGFLGVKLYGSIDPSWVKPIAQEAHSLGMSVQGHIPAKMRPSGALAAGYDGINHINFILMEAMPDDVVATSNGLNRFFGPGKHGHKVDLMAAPMAPLLNSLAEKKIVVDPTLGIYEGIYVPEQGEVAPAFLPWLGRLPVQLERRFKSGGLVAPPEFAVERSDMRKTFQAMLQLVGKMHKMGIPIVAGTDSLAMMLVRELELYVQAGMSIGDALETATDGAARAMGAEGRVASIAEGQTADLVLIDGDVSKDIGALRQVETIMLGGKLIDAAALRRETNISRLPKRK